MIFFKLTVQTLDEASLKSTAGELLRTAQAICQPNLLVGVRTGGYVVAEHMRNASAPTLPLLPITCRRPSTQKKQESSALKLLLARLPYVVTNILRIVEHVFITRKRPQVINPFTPDPQELAAIRQWLAERPAATVLVIDDSVDSGATLQAVIQAIKAVAPASATIKSAAITVTTHSPLIQPDISLYRYVLCRFPWSFDFKR